MKKDYFIVKNSEELKKLNASNYNFYIIGCGRLTKKRALEGITLGITIYAKPKKVRE